MIRHCFTFLFGMACGKYLAVLDSAALIAKRKLVGEGVSRVDQPFAAPRVFCLWPMSSPLFCDSLRITSYIGTNLRGTIYQIVAFSQGSGNYFYIGIFQLLTRVSAKQETVHSRQDLYYPTLSYEARETTKSAVSVSYFVTQERCSSMSLPEAQYGSPEPK
jgi:hypothetical protein